MNRLPFDPDRADGAPETGRPRMRHVGEADVLTVSQLGGIIKRTLEQRIASPIRVIGEVSNLTSRGHLYFSLKDEDA
ncbi:MAG: exodeoxyribonuclease VII large subunit, partial [Planctomycetota bacterium]